MSLKRKIKNNRFVRGFYFGWQRNFGWLDHRKFGYIADNVILTPPLSGDVKNVYIYEM